MVDSMYCVQYRYGWWCRLNQCTVYCVLCTGMDGGVESMYCVHCTGMDDGVGLINALCTVYWVHCTGMDGAESMYCVPCTLYCIE